MRPEDAEIATRCAAAVARALSVGIADDELDATVADLHRLPAELPRRGTMAAGLVVAITRDATGLPNRLRHLAFLIMVAGADQPSIAEWPRRRAAGRALAIGYATMNRAVPDFGAALDELDELTAAYGDDNALRTMLASTRMAVEMLHSMETGDEAVLLRLQTQMQSLREFAPTRSSGDLADLVDVALAGLRANQAGDHAGAFTSLSRLQAMVGELPAGHMMRGVMDETAAMAEPFRRMLAAEAAGSSYQPTDEELATIARLAERPDAPAGDRALNHASTGGALLAMGQESDPNRVDAAIQHFRQAVDLAGPDHQHRAYFLYSLALALYHRADVQASPQGLDEALDIIEEAETVMGGPQHPQWQPISEVRAAILRRLGKAREARRVGLNGLRANVWQALAQADPRAARISIRRAADDAIGLARRCLGDNEPEDALGALDAGRALLLFAATGLRDVSASLDAAGHPDLARRWREAAEPGHAPEKLTALRREILGVLSRDRATITRLLDSPSLTEIRSALRTLDTDALAYLIPGQPAQPGFAVIAPAYGPPSYMVLPDLTIDGDIDVERYLAALARRDLGPVEDRDELVASLDTLCDWAWRAAIGPLIDRYLATRDSAPALAGSVPGGRVPRVVLVPMGDLARIPWGAARRPDGTYAVQLAAFSQAASARMLCDTAGRSSVPLTPTGLVIADPDTGQGSPLLAARQEAHAIHETFYPGARYLGRRPDGSTSRSGAGTADDVRVWLTNTSPAAGAMLHLACHGDVVVGPDEPKSFLRLAADEHGGELSAEELVDIMARAPQRAVGLVVLAACRTGTPMHGYDEVYSLGTAFLAGGARSVLSAQWRIPDVTTSSLMFMFHHYLRHHRLPAWRALRHAQLWMLDPHRQAPPNMPAELRARAVSTDHAQVVAWAGFVHWGQ